jgi:hypothetical protein
MVRRIITDIQAVQNAMLYVSQDMLPKRLFHIVDESPETFLDLCGAISAGDLPVLGKYCEQTIYGEAIGNIFQRVFHDSIHLALREDFDAVSEYRVAMEQCRRVESRFGSLIGDILWADLQGQTEHMQKYGRFPVDQVNFVVDYLRKGKV